MPKTNMKSTKLKTIGMRFGAAALVCGVATGLAACGGTTTDRVAAPAPHGGLTAAAPVWAKDVANCKDVPAAYAALSAGQKTEFAKYMEVTTNKVVEQDTKTTASGGVRTTVFGSYVQYYNGLGQEAYRLVLKGHATSYESSGQLANVYLDELKVESQSTWYSQGSINKKVKKQGPTVGVAMGTFLVKSGFGANATEGKQQCLRGMIASSKSKVSVQYTQTCGM